MSNRESHCAAMPLSLFDEMVKYRSKEGSVKLALEVDRLLLQYHHQDQSLVFHFSLSHNYLQ